MTYGKNKKEIYAPSYYKSFKCIADKCKHSCCIGWEIPIDGETLSKYANDEKIMATVDECDDGACFKLCDDGRCPHLDNQGLCRIIISHGEDYLSDICKNHPRFFNYVNGGNIEAGLGIACEEACRIIFKSDSPFSLVRIDNSKSMAPSDGGSQNFDECYFDPLPKRDRIISFAENARGNINEKFKALRREFGIPEFYSVNEWTDRLLRLEILDTGWEETLKAAKLTETKRGCLEQSEYDKYYSRLFTYFVFRHLSVAESEDNLRARLAFSMLSVEMIRHIFEACGESLDDLMDIARRYSLEIEYSEDNTAELIFEFESEI